MTTEEVFDGAGKGFDLALPGDTIRTRHIATRASNRRRIIVLVEGDAEFEGYSIGLDKESLQLLELPSGEVSSISLKHIVSITDGLPFSELSREMKDIVDRRTASFKKTSQNWLVANWPNVYDRRDEPSYPQEHARDRAPRINSRMVRREYQARQEFEDREKELSTDGDSQVRERAGEGRDQS